MTLADYSVLKIRVSLDSRYARRWLPFQGPAEANDVAWFRRFANERVPIRWTEDLEDHVWQGNLHRVVEFDRQTRTLTVAFLPLAFVAGIMGKFIRILPFVMIACLADAGWLGKSWNRPA